MVLEEAPTTSTVSSMPRARTTNNSVSSLAEQTEIIRSMSDKASKGTACPSSPKGQDLGKKQKKKAAAGGKKTLDPEPLPQGDNVAIPRPAGAGGVPGNQGAEPSVNQASGSDVTPRVQNMASFPPQHLMAPYGQHMPVYFPHSMGFQGFYPPGMGVQLEQQEEDSWEDSESVCTVSSGAPMDGMGPRQGDHEMSDDEDEGPLMMPAPQKRVEASLDFSGLKEGKLAQLLQSRHQKVKEDEKLTPPINETLAAIVNAFFEETKVAGELEKLTKEYPQVKNMDKQLVPKLDAELFTAIDPQVRAVDVALQGIQKGVVAAVSAMAPIGSLMLERGNTDKELDELSGNMLDAMHILALTSKGLEHRRRETLKPNMQQTYAKALGKAHEGDPQWLYGGNLSEATRKCEVAKKLADKIVKRKTPQQSQGHQHNKQNPQGGNQNKRFKQPNKQNWQNFQQAQSGQKAFGYQHFQMPQVQMQTPYTYGYQNQQYQQYKGKGPRQQQGQANGGNNQDFQKRGAQK